MRTLSRYLIITTAATLLIPSFALARNGSENSPNPSASPRVAAGQICTKIGDITGKVSTDTNDRFTQLGNDFAARDANVNQKAADVSAKIAASRAQWDAKRLQDFAKLEAKATNAAQKQDILNFETAVKAAVATRRAAVDAADAAFKNGVLAAINARQTQLKTAATTYKNAVASALAAAKASCAVGTSPEAVRTNLQNALKTARANLETARAAVSKVGPNVDTLKATRKAAVLKADTDFKAAVQAALAALKTALGADKPSASASPSPSATP